MNASLELARQVLAAQPFSVLLDARVTVFGAGAAELRLPIVEKLKQQNGFLHGGVVSYAADNVLTFAGGSVLGPAVVTAEYKINFVRPAVGDELVARASVVHAGKNQAVCRCEIFSVSAGQETLCAVAQGTIASLSQSANRAV
jgi:uncharacterized protein (TIGR00369 family)